MWLREKGVSVMFRWLGALGCFLWCLGGISAVAWAEASIPFALGTKPTKAKFRLLNSQGAAVIEGTTPFVSKLEAGVYRLIVSMDGYHEEARTLRVEAGKPVFLDIELLAISPKKAGEEKKAPVGRGTAPPQQVAPTSSPSQKVGHSAAPAQRIKEPTSLPATTQPSQGEPPPSEGTKKSKDLSPNVPPDREMPPPVAARKVGGAQVTITQRKKETPKKARPIPWVPLAIAAACGIAGGVFFGLSQTSLDASKDVTRTQVDAYSEFLNAQSHRTTAFSLLIAGGAALAVAGLMYSGILKSRNSASRSTRGDRYAPITQRARPSKDAMATRKRAPKTCRGSSRAGCSPFKGQPTRLLSLDGSGGVF